MAVILKINDLEIMGAVGNGATVSMHTYDCWAAYRKHWIRNHVVPGAAVTVLRRNTVWSVNNREIPWPQSWFITLQDQQQIPITLNQPEDEIESGVAV